MMSKAELLQEGISFLIHLFSRDVLVTKKLEVEKNQAHFNYINFKSWILGGLVFIEFLLFYY